MKLNYLKSGKDIFLMMLLGLLVASPSQVGAALGKLPFKATLGSTTAPISVARMAAATSNSPSTLYTIHEVQLENGTTIREYATSSSQVFAVIWQGPVLPDLNTLLGDYFSTFKLAAAQARQAGRRGSPVHAERDGLVVVSSGRMRNFFGYAYAPELVPVGVNIQDVLQ